MVTERTTWKRLATTFAAGLHDKTCTDHEELHDDCPYCRDTAALQEYQAKLSGQSDLTWQQIVTKLARRFQHFEECTAHGTNDPDPEHCPFCHDEDRWRRYVDFCSRQGVTPVRRDADLIDERATAISIYDLRRDPHLADRGPGQQ